MSLVMDPLATLSPAAAGSDAPRVAVVAGGDDVAARRLELALAAAGLAPAAPGADADAAVVLLGPAAGRDALRGLRAQAPGCRLVGILRDGDGSRRAARRALLDGADGLVRERDVPAALAATVRAVLAGQVVLPREAREQAEPGHLSAREREALTMVVLGLTNKEIAARLFVAESTVKSHLKSAFGKLGVASRAEATELLLTRDASFGAGIVTLTAGAPEPVPAGAPAPAPEDMEVRS
jgi:DNA-binding NarL/FixJ family response regulator